MPFQLLTMTITIVGHVPLPVWTAAYGSPQERHWYFPANIAAVNCVHLYSGVHMNIPTTLILLK